MRWGAGGGWRGLGVEGVDQSVERLVGNLTSWGREVGEAIRPVVDALLAWWEGLPGWWRFQLERYVELVERGVEAEKAWRLAERAARRRFRDSYGGD